jgi:hypothetical protein
MYKYKTLERRIDPMTDDIACTHAPDECRCVYGHQGGLVAPCDFHPLVAAAVIEANLPLCHACIADGEVAVSAGWAR